MGFSGRDGESFDSLDRQEQIRQQRWDNSGKTWLETGLNFTKSALPIAAVALLGIDVLAAPSAILHEIQSSALLGPVPFLGGFGVGILQNALLIKRTLHNLDGKTEHGTLLPIETEADGTYVAQITCVDARRFNTSGGAFPGSFAVLGAEISSVIAAGAIGNLSSSANPILDAAVGYTLGSNILTGLKSHMDLFNQINKIAQQARIQAGGSSPRVKIVMEDHWDGCGAQGFTNVPSYLAKFKLHNAFHLADIIGIPNEILGYMYVNSVLSPLVALASRGQVSLSASVIHSPMHK